MRILPRYLKPHLAALLAAIALLFVQAFSELNLPNLMSDIINVGIAQYGIEYAAPDVISENGFDLMTSVMTEDEKEKVKAAYEKKNSGDITEKGGVTSEVKTVYTLKDRSRKNYEALDPVFARAGWTFIFLMQDKATPDIIKNLIAEDMKAQMMKNPEAAAAMASGGAPDLSAMPADGNAGNEEVSTNLDNIDITQAYQLTPYLKRFPENTLKSARDKAGTVQDSIRSQTGVVFTRLFYKELGFDIGAIERDYLVRTGLMMIGLTLLNAIAAVSVGYFASKIAAGVAKALRHDLFEKVLTFAAPEFGKFSEASLITRSTNDITQVQTFIIMAVRIMCFAPIMGAGGVIMALRRNVSMSWIIFIAVVALIVFIVLVFLLVVPKFKKIQSLVDKMNLVMRENLNGMSVVRAFGNQAYEENRFDEENKKVTDINLFVNRVMVFMMPLMMLLMNGVTLTIIWVGGHQIEAGALQVGDMMAYMQYAMQIIISFVMISVMFIMVPRSQVSLDRIADVLETDPMIKDPETPTAFKEKSGTVVFDHVSFRYPGAKNDVLSDITFTARPGETTAFIGATGSGKSTLVSLLPRFSDVTQGSIHLDRTDIRDVTLHDLRSRIGFVPQKANLFSGNVASNLRFGDENADEKTMQTAIDIAQATDFVAESHGGLTRPIAQSGGNISGGQKQRLAIARALTKKPEVYVFDDSFSALDFKTDAKLRKALKPYTENATVLLVAQRVSTIMHAEQIIVLDEGRIIGKGTHDELMKNCETYRDIADSQLKKEMM